jgi:hypothetical protein
MIIGECTEDGKDVHINGWLNRRAFETHFREHHLDNYEVTSAGRKCKGCGNVIREDKEFLTHVRERHMSRRASD